MPIVRVDESPEVVAIVATMGRNLPRLHACVDSLRAGSDATSVAVVCVVNSSTAVDVQLDDATVLQAGLNLGWAGALVFAASQSDSEFIWFVQDDMAITATTLSFLVDALKQDSTLSAVSPLVVGHDGLVPVGSCGGVVNEIGNVVDPCPPVACLPEDLPDTASLSYFPSRGLLVRRAAFTAVGGPNARLYPVQFVDVDFNFRLRDRVGPLRLVTRAIIHHETNGSSPVYFAHFLHERNIETFAHRWLGNDVHPSEPFFAVAEHRPDPVGDERLPLHPGIPAEVLAEVSQSAADALTHLGRVFTATRSELSAVREELAGTLAALDESETAIRVLKNTRSWKFTAGMRAVVSTLHRLRRR